LIIFFKKVWEESSGESLLQMQLLIALRNFVMALGYQSPICYNILLPILQKGIDVNGPDELNLLEDSMLVSLLFPLHFLISILFTSHLDMCSVMIFHAVVGGYAYLCSINGSTAIGLLSLSCGYY